MGGSSGSAERRSRRVKGSGNRPAGFVARMQHVDGRNRRIDTRSGSSGSGNFTEVCLCGTRWRRTISLSAQAELEPPLRTSVSRGPSDSASRVLRPDNAPERRQSFRLFLMGQQGGHATSLTPGMRRWDESVPHGVAREPWGQSWIGEESSTTRTRRSGYACQKTEKAR